MKKLSLILFSILMIFSVCINVNAVGFSVDGIPGIGNLGVNNPNISGSFIGLPNVHVGIRISFVNNYGKDIKNMDYYFNKNASTNNTRYDYAGGKSKTYYLTTNNDINFSPNSLVIDSYSTLNNLFKKYGFTSLENIRYKGAYFSIDGVNQWVNYAYDMSLIDNWFSKEYYVGNEDDYDSNLKGLLEELLSGTGYELTEENIKKLFMVVEPTTMIYYDNSLYYGTAYELSTMAVGSPANMAHPEYTYGQTLLSSFATHLGFNIPCSSYLTGSIYNDMIASLGTAISGFTAGKYFNSVSILPQICTTNSYKVTYADGTPRTGLKQEYLTGRYGIGMAVVWFYDKLNFDKELTCKIVYEKATGTTYDESKPISCEKVEDLVSNFQAAINSDKAFKLEYPNYKYVDKNWYESTCGCKPTVGDDCTPDYQIGTCSSKDQLSYNDISTGKTEQEFWNQCVYKVGTYSIGTHKSSIASSAYNYKDTNLVNSNNSYCEVNCVEELQTNFKVISESNVFKAGYHFTWPTGTTVGGTRTCKLKLTESSWKTYKTDLNGANENTLDYYTQYSKNLTKYNLLTDAKIIEENSSHCECKNEVKLTLTCERGEECTDKEEYEDRGYSVKPIGSDEYNVYYKVTGCDGRYDRYEMNQSIGKYLFCDVAKGCIEKTTNVEKKLCEDKRDEQMVERLEDIDDYYKKYTEEQEKAYNAVKLMQQCYTWADEENKDKIYNLNPIVELDNINIGYPIDSELKRLEVDSIIEDFSPDIQCEENTDYYYTCDETSCEKIDNIVDNCSVKKLQDESKVTVRYEKTIQYKLNENLFRYVQKVDNLSVSKLPTANSYIDVGYGNLPIAYKMPDGVYNISLKYYNLGHSSSPSFTALDNIFEDLKEWGKSENYGVWSCNYTVVSKLIPEETIHSGIDVIYRPIDLNNPFPSMYGDGRETGSNWCYNDGTKRDCSNNNQLVTKVITDSIPDEPMYSFTLTPSIIQKIRAYNKDNRYDDFKLTCEANTGKACVSDFLTELKNIYSEDVGGTCFKDSFSRVSNSESFYSGCKKDYTY